MEQNTHTGLDDQEKTLLAFSLFTTGMRVGPVIFGKLQSIAEKNGIADILEFYAKDWVDFSRNFDEAKKLNVSLFKK